MWDVSQFRTTIPFYPDMKGKTALIGWLQAAFYGSIRILGYIPSMGPN